jgi:F-type H+-transporting ATPase subunit gamma
MAKARAIVKRRRAVQNIRKITSTMQLIATARFQKCLQRAMASKPYTARIVEMLQTLSGQADIADPLLRPNAQAQRSILLTITSNRGLCGAYNATVLRVAMQHYAKLLEQQITPLLEMVGKKGVNFCRFLGYELAETITDVEDRIAFSRVAEIAERYMRGYREGELARVDVAFMRFHSVAVQRPAVVQLLPIQPAEPAEPTAPTPRQEVEFDFSPPPAQLLAALIPESVKIHLYQCFNDAIVSEQVSRMVAMKAATDAGGDMIRHLTREYNRARQSQITLELADIVGGAEAVK